MASDVVAQQLIPVPAVPTSHKGTSSNPIYFASYEPVYGLGMQWRTCAPPPMLHPWNRLLAPHFRLAKLWPLQPYGK